MPDDSTQGDKEKVCVWPDGTWCFLYELAEYNHMSDDYEIREYDENVHN
jgi:hypothetical protein